MKGATLPSESPFSKASNKRSLKGSPGLRDQAAVAALYVMQPEDTARVENRASLSNSNQRLSTAGAAASFKQANLRGLPSFPPLGISNGPSSASSSHKPASRWKASPSASAFAAAGLAKDFRSANQWQPESSVHGAKAALLAHARNLVEISPSGNPASPQSYLSNLGLNPRPDRRYTTAETEESQQAATRAMAAKRWRSKSAPTTTSTWLDSGNSAANSLNAAATAHSPSVEKTTVLAGGLQSTNNTNSMPPGSSRFHTIARSNITQSPASTHALSIQETAERNRADVRAAAVSMARQSLAAHQGSVNGAEWLGSDGHRQAANAASAWFPSSSTTQAREQMSMCSNSPKEAASKLASERLTRIRDEHEAHRNCYGMSQAQSPPLIRGMIRQRAFSVVQCTAQDKEQSRKVRPETSLLADQVGQADAKKSERDCMALIATAHRNVQACLHKMDEKILSDTGRLAPSTQEEWLSKATAAAEAESQFRMSNYGKMDIRGGKFIDPKEVDAAAAKNVQPLLDEINEKTEKERAKQEGIRLGKGQKRRTVEEERRRGRKLRDERKRAKGEHFASHVAHSR